MCHNEIMLRFRQIDYLNSLRFTIWEAETMCNIENSTKDDRVSDCGSERLKNSWINLVKHKCLVQTDKLARTKY